MSVSQPRLFAIDEGPEGFRYAPGLLSQADEAALVAHLKDVPFRAFAFHGFEGKRRTHSYGWRYVFDGSGLQAAEPIPGWLLPPRAAAAHWAGFEPEALEHVLLTEYEPGAAIGWHRDRSVFGDVVGLSLPLFRRMLSQLGVEMTSLWT